LPAISVEGFKEETDARRGKGHYDKVMNAMRLLKEAGILFAYSATMTSQNADLLVSDRFVDHWIDQGCILGWYFLYIPVGKETEWELVPTPEQRNLLRERIAHFRGTKEIFFGDFWNDGPEVGGCIAGGRKYLHINSKGDVEPCVFCHFAMHNINDTPLREAVTSPMFKKIRENQMSNDNLLQPCMIIDHPEQYRHVCSMPGVTFTHEGAEGVITKFAPSIDEYATQWGKLAEEAWKNRNGNEGC
jgi:MoaA/NifB/PqqE/SkfB family radical SAM enzyme